ncbi:MAG: hypothetical protein HYT97_04965 [Elusimicrobia bacterium]|nr:hypothetical protein [Elusimicrobiota bacterium]
MSAQFGKILILIGVLLSFSQSVFAIQGKRTNFLDSGPGAAGMSFGGALVAKGLDVSAAYYNPATLVMQNSGAFLEYSQPNVNASRSWLGLSAGGSRYSLGFLWKNETLPLSSNKNAFLMSSSVSDRSIPFLPKGSSIGLSLGYIQENIVGYSASSFLVSAGAAYTKTVRSWDFGVGTIIRNLYFSGLQFISAGDKEVWPIEPEFGGYISKWGVKVLMSAKGQNQNDLQYGFGLGYQPVSFVEFRAGMNGHPRFGVGLEIKKIRLDYAMSLGEIKNANSMTLSYLWGKPEKIKDYTNPITELSARYESLPEYILAELKNTAQSGDIPELHDVFRLLVVDPKSEDGWSFYTALTGKKRFKVRLPFFNKSKRQYLDFAVSFANDAANSKELGQQFIYKYPRSSVSKLIKEILVSDEAVQ